MHGKERKLLQSALGGDISIFEKTFRKNFWKWFESGLASSNSDPEITFHNVFYRIYVHAIAKNSGNNPSVHKCVVVQNIIVCSCHVILYISENK